MTRVLLPMLIGLACAVLASCGLTGDGLQEADARAATAEERAEQAEQRIAYLEAQLATMQADRVEDARLIERLISLIEQARAERDAALEEMRLAADALAQE